MKHIATVALMLNLGVAGVYAQQKPVTMTFSGTSAASTINLQQPNTTTGEDNLAGNGTLGTFTFRNIFAESTIPQPSSTCSGPTLLHFSRVAGAGVFRRRRCIAPLSSFCFTSEPERTMIRRSL